MTFSKTIALAFSMPWLGMAAPVDRAPTPTPAAPIDQLVADLSSPDFTTREEATTKLLALGDVALPKLEKVSYGSDPEQAYRAREMVRKIELAINADTDPAIVSLVERYLTATPEAKMTLLTVMRQKRAWRQILTLFAREKNADVQARYQEWVGQVAVIAARESIVKADPIAARHYLEMAPANSAGLLALADFHRSQGTLETELKRAKLVPGQQSLTWQLALHRAAGNLSAARDAAVTVGDVAQAATLSALLGDPLPWLRMGPAQDHGPFYPHYTDLAIRRWSGLPLGEKDLAPLVLATQSKNSVDRQNASAALFLLGQPALAEPAYAKDSPLMAFSYFESLQRIPEAHRCLGIDHTHPDYTAWAAEKFAHLIDQPAPDPDTNTPALQQMVAVACFLELRGKFDLCDQAFRKPLAQLAAADSKRFTNLLRLLFVGYSAEGGAPLTALHAASDWAGTDAGRWNEIVTESIGEQDEIQEIWNWMAEVDPKATFAARFEGLLALFDFHRDPELLQQRWMALFWQNLATVPAAQRDALYSRMQFLLRIKPDVATSLKLWKQLPEPQRGVLPWQFHIADLSAAERWTESADQFLREITEASKSHLDVQPALYAYAAAALRKAGREKEALTHDRLTDQLALGSDAGDIAMAYQYGADYSRAATWWQRAVIQSELQSKEFENALEQHLTNLLDQQDWQKAAAIAEVQAQLAAATNLPVGSALRLLRLRLPADFARALAQLKQDRTGSIARLEACFELLPTDGSLADAFFPALLQSNLKPNLESWFKRTWDVLQTSIDQYPEADNLYNTAAWLAARAQLHLPQSEAFLKKALALNPLQASYLDTLAETHFAMGNRAQALKWSRLSINNLPSDTQIRRQFERFKSAPLPPARRP
jgi:hypothetical protein